MTYTEVTDYTSCSIEFLSSNAVCVNVINSVMLQVRLWIVWNLKQRESGSAVDYILFTAVLHLS